jgi:hypothetical protein
MEEVSKYPDFLIVVKDSLKDDEAERLEKKVKEKFSSVALIFGDIELYQKEEIYKKVF